MNSINSNSLYKWHEHDYMQLCHLYNAKKRLPHSILLYGMAGTGISQLALYWIKFILCELPKNNRPCDKCSSCVLLLNKGHPDLYTLSDLETDTLPTKNKTITVDSIREVIEFLTLSPHLGGYKIVFIPNLNLLNLSSANALLKILEEPPDYALFVLASTNIGQILPTIKSRCYKQLVSRPKLLGNLDGSSECILEGNLVANPDINLLNKFWLAYYDNCPLYQDVLAVDELQIFISALTIPSIENIFALSHIVDGKTIKFSFVVDFLQKWLSDVTLYKMTEQLTYFYYFKNYIIPIMPKLQIDKVFYLNDRLSFLQKWVNHPLNYKLQIENLLFQYQQIFVID